jgi:hypothetical protein
MAISLIAYLDDASRFIVGYGIFDEATIQNAISILDDCVKRVLHYTTLA